MMTRTKATTKPKPSAAMSGAEDSGEEIESEPQPTLGDLHNTLQEFKNFISGKFDKLSNEVSAINNRFEELESSVSFNSAKILEIEKERLPKFKDSVQQTIKSLENKVTMLEIHNRKSNLLFYGLQQNEGENVYQVLKGAFVSLGLDDTVASRIALANAHRLPQRQHGAQAARQAPVPIIARFCYMLDRNSVLAAFEEQQRKRTKAPAEPGHAQSRLSVRTDLPPAMKIRRGILANEAYKLRKERGLATRIFVKGTEVHLQWKEKGTTKWNDFEE